jgi:hypothetical protein
MAATPGRRLGATIARSGGLSRFHPFHSFQNSNFFAARRVQPASHSRIEDRQAFKPLSKMETDHVAHFLAAQPKSITRGRS